VAAVDNAGWSVSGAGDFNGDGYDDLIVGAPGADKADQGVAYLLFGHAGGFSANLDLGKLTAADGFEIHGASKNDFAGVAVSSAGDINGDGYDDLVIGASGVDGTDKDAGAGIVIYGGHFTDSPVSLVQGTTADDALAEILVGGQGNDTIGGGGGADSIQGGAGNDTIHLTDTAVFRVDGGGGFDTLELDLSGSIDFANLRGKISSIEEIDVTNGSNNAMTLHLGDLLANAPQDSNFGGKASLDNVLVINGNAGDTLSLSPSDNWGAADTTTLSGYAIYTVGIVKVAIDTDISVS
jgi:hypothetical protein